MLFVPFLYFLLPILPSAQITGVGQEFKPHIIWVIADDLGYDDVAFTGTGCQIKTPTLDKFANEGVILDNYYVNAICTPTRSSLMTGRYPMHLGLQHGVIRDSFPDGVPLNESMIARYMKKAGYKTHIVGKWHLGFYKHEYTPQARGFDSHYGYYTGNEEYWNHTSPCWGCGNYTALDLHFANATYSKPILNANDIYSTNLFSDTIEDMIENHDPSVPLFLYAPFEAVHGAASCYKGPDQPPNCQGPAGDLLQAPDFYIDQQSHIKDPQRRVFAGMVGALDDAVKNITSRLASKNMLDKTVLVFTTDNGAPWSHFGGGVMSNWPLKGGKGEIWEGGVKGAAFVWAGSQVPLEKKKYRNNELIHCSDWFLTFANLAGQSIKETKDGVNAWETISSNSSSLRNEILHNIDPNTGHSAIRVGKWKLLQGMGTGRWGPNPHPKFVGIKSNLNESANQEITMPIANKIYLYNIENDPQERNNLADAEPDVVQQLQKRIAFYEKTMVHPRNPKSDPAAQPKPIPGLVICTEGICRKVGIWEPWK